jgi:hypothetical protein
LACPVTLYGYLFMILTLAPGERPRHEEDWSGGSELRISVSAEPVGYAPYVFQLSLFDAIFVLSRRA